MSYLWTVVATSWTILLLGLAIDMILKEEDGEFAIPLVCIAVAVLSLLAGVSIEIYIQAVGDN